MPKHHRSPPSLKRQHSTGLHQVHHNRRGTWAGQKVDARSMTHVSYELVNDAATRVQAMFRGNKHRATVAAGRATVAAKKEAPVHSAFELVNEAATRVQAMFRGKSGRAT